MKTYLLINPEVKNAYFSEYLECSLKECQFVLNKPNASLVSFGPLNLIEVELNEKELEIASKLSFFQAAFKGELDKLTPLDLSPNFKLHDNFIFGSKFKGKTNERFTQMILNIGLSTLPKKDKIKVLDPMCGRATSLLWAMRYGFNAKGIEADFKAINDISQIVKKWSKVCSIQSNFKEGFVGKKTKNNIGKFLLFESQNQQMKVVIGNSTNASSLLANEKFDLLISDIPYGIQHLANKGAKNPLETLRECLPEWKKILSKEGTIVIGYNSNNPKRRELEKIAIELGFEVVDFSIPHRMSESIVRDIIILR